MSARRGNLAVVDEDVTANGSPRCHGIKANGQRCGGFAGKSGYCFNHDPNTTEQQKYAVRASGGKATSTTAKMQRMLPPRLRAVFERLDTAMVDVVEGNLSTGRATALAALASASVRVLQAGEFEERLRTLEHASGSDEEADLAGDDDEG